MSNFASVEVPFVTIGNRRGLTAVQLMQHDWLRDFFARFRDSFEPHPNMNIDAVLFIEPEDAR